MTLESTAAAQQGYLLLADISGYTEFLQSVEVAHGAEMARSGMIPPAYPIMATLIEGIADGLIPPFVLSKTEGDAVFAFASVEEMDLHGQHLLDHVEVCYGRFRERLAAMEAARTCNCSACLVGITLDLKFILHAGMYVTHPIAGRKELLGPDVNVVHRLLKNSARDVVPSGAYTLCTAAAASLLELPVEHAVPLIETHQHIGPIDCYVFSLPASTGTVEE